MWAVTFDLISQRVIDVLLAFPGIILAMLLLAALGGWIGYRYHCDHRA